MCKVLKDTRVFVVTLYFHDLCWFRTSLDMDMLAKFRSVFQEIFTEESSNTLYTQEQSSESGKISRIARLGNISALKMTLDVAV